jgi:tetratricopeptide (TPR) repeat protein
VAAADSPLGAAKSVAKEVSVSEAQKWAAALQRAVRVQDVDTFNKLVDWDAFVATATALPSGSAQLKEFSANFARESKIAIASPKAGFGRAVMGAIEVSGEYRPLRAHREGGQERVLFRLLASSGALNYHDWVLGRSRDGEVVATDCYVFLIGEMYSQNLRQSFLPMAHKKGGASVDELSGPEKDFVSHFDEFAQMGRYVHDKNWRQALNIYEQLPPSVQHSKAALTTRLLATQAISNSEYLASIDEFRKQHPNDAPIDLISVDAFILRKSYDKAIEAIGRVDKAVGGDPYLKVLRGSILARENKPDAARDLLEKAVAEEPTLLRGYYALIDVSAARHDFADTLKWLKKAESQGVRFGDLKTIPAFAEFVKSPEYKSWLKSRSQKN